MDRNFVRKGDKVVKYVTPIGSIGTGNGQYWAHLHFSISEGLTPEELKGYISGWSMDKVKRYYREPKTKDVDFQKMFGRKMDVGNWGYGWLQWVGYGFHPGLDVNGLGGGNTDIGYVFKSSCDGEVVYEWRGWTKNGGWGNLVMIEERESEVPSAPPSSEKRYNLKGALDKEAKEDFWMGEDFDEHSPKDHEHLAKKMKKIRKNYIKMA